MEGSIKEARIKEPYHTYLNVSVYIVQKCNFNDEFLLENKQVPLKELDGKPLFWFDPYLGRWKESRVKIAVAEVKDKKLCYLEEKDGVIAKKALDGGVDFCYTENYDERTLISVHLSLTSYKY